MASAEQLIQVFLEAAHRASIFPLASEAMVYALKSFGQTDLQIPVAVAILGALAGHCFNLWLGRMIMRLPSAPKHHRLFALLQTHFNRYGFVALVLCFASLGNILVVLAGMFGTPLRKALPMILIGLLYYYGRIVVTLPLLAE